MPETAVDARYRWQSLRKKLERLLLHETEDYSDAKTIVEAFDSLENSDETLNIILTEDEDDLLRQTVEYARAQLPDLSLGLNLSNKLKDEAFLMEMKFTCKTCDGRRDHIHHTKQMTQEFIECSSCNGTGAVL